MRKLVGAGSFILVVKTLKGINLITDTPVKIFIGFIKCVGMSDVMFKPPKQKSQTSLMFGMDATNL
ncbi:hypothetical protein [Helicobacter pylori]|uniref:hypothetical protein n=1 Tax=Helicobacter pylori TaxID=210 RepID=UPI001AA33FA4|nr:hypothetical protein VN0647_03470 [Helicobacter pylori]